MSKYTTQLRFICENLSGLYESKGFDDVDEIIEKARVKLFNFNYPITTSHKQELETKIISHYYTREIGLESVGLFKLKLATKLREIMPYYKQLYETTLMQIDVFNDTDYSETNERTDLKNTESDEVSSSENLTTNSSTNSVDSTSVNSVDVVGKNISKECDTPQGTINFVDDGSYLSKASIQDTTNNSDSVDNFNSDTQDNSTTNSNVDYTKNYNVVDNLKSDNLRVVKGKTSSDSYAKRLQEYRDILLNVDLMIINDLSELFMNIY